MYQIQVASGQVDTFHSIDDLIAGIRTGVITSHAHIYHQKSGKWLPITVHPHFKIAQSIQAPITRAAVVTPALVSVASDPVIREAWRSHTRGRVALMALSGVIATAAAVAAPTAGAWLLDSPSTPSRVTHEVAASMANSGMVGKLDNPASNSTAGLQTAAHDSVARIVELPKAPKIVSAPVRLALELPDLEAPFSAVKTPAALIRKYLDAYESARGDLDAALRRAGFAQLFAESKLKTGQAVRNAQMSLAGAANLIKVYRQRETSIEAEYRDSVQVLAQRNKWTLKQIREWEGRAAQQESRATVARTDALLKEIERLYSLLAGQEKKYEIVGGRITFLDLQASRDYAELHRSLTEQLSSSESSARGAVPTTTGRVLRAIGSTRLPDRRSAM